MDVAEWLRGLGLDQYLPAFRDNDVDGDVLCRLTSEDLRELGVTSLGHRKKLVSAIAALATPPHAELEPASAPAPAATKAARAERRHLTVMFVDLVGSTALSARLDPEDMREILAAYHGVVAAGVKRFEGYVAKFMGDGVLAYFGWPQAHEGEAERAVRAGLAVVEAVDKLQTGAERALAARVGIATGLVVVGDLVGEGAAQEEAVVGETPNIAARLQQLAAPGAVVIADSTRRLLGGMFTLAELGPQSVRGVNTPIPVFRVLREAPTGSRFEALRRAALAPLIGREHELALLVNRWETAKAGEGQLILLSGEAGIGKSRLVLALRERLRGESCFQIAYSCSPYHSNSALWPMIAQLERAAAYARDEPPPEKLDKLEALLRQAGEPVADAVPVLAELLGLPLDSRHPAPGGTPQEKKARIFAVLLTQLEGLARQRPMLVVLEDAHWLDPTTTEFFDRVAERIRGLPVLLVITFRPEAAPPWTRYLHTTMLSLNRLSQSGSRALVERTAGEQLLPAPVVHAILAHTEGVPLFVEELTKTLLESAILTTTAEDGSFVFAGALPPLAIPPTLQDSLLARLDRLAPAREVAQTAACIGREFDEEIVGAVAGLSQTRLAEALDQLCRAELVQRRGAAPRHAKCMPSSTRSSAMRPTPPYSSRAVSSCTGVSRRRSNACGRRLW
jgi:class 3 adenylate cyclase